MQAFSPFNPVGAQHNYPSALHGLRAIVAKEGPRGLARGVDAAMLRTAMGSSVQLPSYNLAKTTLVGWGMGDHIGTFLLSSTFSGLVVCAVMQPAGASRRSRFLHPLDGVEICTDAANLAAQTRP